MLEQTTDILFALLRSALWGRDEAVKPMTDDVANNVLVEAARQAVLGMAAQTVLDRGLLSQKMSVVATQLVDKIRSRNEEVSLGIAHLSQFMKKRELPFVVVKGQVVAQGYSSPLLRQSGDVDFYCSPAVFPLAVAAFEKILQRPLVPDESEKHVEFVIEGVIYELHSSLSEFAYSGNQAYFNQIIEEDVARGGESVELTYRLPKTGEERTLIVPTLSVTMNALYLFVHIFYHLVTSGVGLRQMADWTMFLHRHQGAIDRQQLETWLQGLGLRKAYTAMGSVLVDVMGLPEEEFPLSLTPQDHRRGRRVLRNILRMGNFGKFARRTKKTGLLHSLETGWISLRQCALFFPLAPKEISCRFPKLTLWFFRRRTGNTQKE
ncbi:MAG: nucleotidyltransferase family protein [Alloprevotella sp.]|nr:nucleotidyltransferase family protein [Alloprevotella sp.]